MLQIGIAILNYLGDLTGAEKEEKAIFAYHCVCAILEKCGIKEVLDKASPL